MLVLLQAAGPDPWVVAPLCIAMGIAAAAAYFVPYINPWNKWSIKVFVAPADQSWPERFLRVQPLSPREARYHVTKCARDSSPESIGHLLKESQQYNHFPSRVEIMHSSREVYVWYVEDHATAKVTAKG